MTHPSPRSPTHKRTSSAALTSPTSPNAAKKSPATKPLRPALSRRSLSGSSHPLHKLGRLIPTAGKPTEEEDADMAASFLQYCAMCEKQILVPSNSVLYCSASCRRKDTNKPLSASAASAPMSPSTTPPSSPPLSPRSVVAPMIPTQPSLRSTAAIRIPSEVHDSKTDLDPTEWKPKIVARHSTSLASSEAWQALSQYYQSSTSASVPNVNGLEAGFRPRPPVHRSSTSFSTLLTGGVPGLTNTPSTASSSLGSATESGLYTNYMYEFHRPLPPRHNPSFSASAKGVELVTPHVAPAEDKWEKRAPAALSPSAIPPDAEGLGKLISEMEIATK